MSLVEFGVVTTIITSNLEQFMTDFVEHIWNQQNYDKLGDFLHDDFVTHRSDGTIEGIDTFHRLVSQFHHSYPDFQVELLNVVGSGNKIAGTYVAEGTLEKDFGSLKATGEHIRIEGSLSDSTPGRKISRELESLGSSQLDDPTRRRRAPGGL